MKITHVHVDVLNINVCLNARMYVCMYLYLYVCMYVCKLIRINEKNMYLREQIALAIYIKN